MTPLSRLRHDQRGYTLAELLVTITILAMVLGAVLVVQTTSNTMFLRGENQAEAQQGARASMLMEEDLRMVGSGCPDLGCPTPPPAGAQQKFTAASATSVTFWADTLNASSSLSANVAVGAATLPVTSAAGFATGDRVYLTNGATWETRTITAIAGNNLTVGALTNAYPRGTLVGRPRQITYSWAGGTLSKDAGDGTGLQTLATGIQALAFSFFDTNDALIAAVNLTANLANIRRVLIQTTAQSTQSAVGAGTYTINTNVRPRNL